MPTTAFAFSFAAFAVAAALAAAAYVRVVEMRQDGVQRGRVVVASRRSRAPGRR